jgi:hypothetical protein
MGTKVGLGKRGSMWRLGVAVDVHGAGSPMACFDPALKRHIIVRRQPAAHRLACAPLLVIPGPSEHSESDRWPPSGSVVISSATTRACSAAIAFHLSRHSGSLCTRSQQLLHICHAQQSSYQTTVIGECSASCSTPTAAHLRPCASHFPPIILDLSALYQYAMDLVC